MLIELPIRLIDSNQADVVGEKAAYSKNGHITILIDCIQALHDAGDDCTTLEATNGSVYLILIQYDVMKKIWQKALQMEHGPFMINHIEAIEPIQNHDDGRVPAATVCAICGGTNFESKTISDCLSTKQCVDCGSTIDQ